MDLEVVGRHALFFDDDAAAASVNSGDALVDWNSLQIDRFDVRHLLSAPLPPRRRRNPQISSQIPDFEFESELDQERYLDLPSPSDEPDGKEVEKPGNPSNYSAVAFSYGNTDQSVVRGNAEADLVSSPFHPPFAVPENLFQSLPPTKKLHQIIARTATFVSKHGGQSEIVLRVKQGDNPTFGFLMPNHNLHPYFRFLVDHQELLQSDIYGKSEREDQIAPAEQSSVVGGSLSLLGSVYGSGDDDDPELEGGHDTVDISPEKTINDYSKRVSYCLGNGSCGSNDDRAKQRPTSKKDGVSVLKKNPSIAASNSGTSINKKQSDESGTFSLPMENSKETLMLEPPSDLKRLIDKIVELIVKNGKEFESALREQDSKHGRLPFLLPSNQYHPYYIKVLQRAEESKFGPRNLFHGREDLVACNMDKRSLISKDNEAMALESFGYDFPFESDRKEKFKMVIGKTRKDMNDPPSSKSSQPENGISVDAAAAAAILLAATRGIRNPALGTISSNAVNGGSYAPGSVLGLGTNSKRQVSSGMNEMVGVSDQSGECHSSLPVAQTAKGVISGGAAKAESSEEHMSREQKLKAERLKRAKMFVAKLKTGSGPSTGDPSQTLATEPIESGALGIGAEVDHIEKVKGGSSALVDNCIPDETEETGRKNLVDEYNERRLRRKYRLRSERHEVNDESDYEEEEDVVESPIKKRRRSHRSSHEGKGRKERDEQEGTKKHSKRKHRPHYSSSDEKDYNNDERKEKSHRHSRKRNHSRHPSHEDEDGDLNYHKHSRKKHPSHRSSHEEDVREDYEDEIYQKHSRKRHRSHRDSHKHTKESPQRSSKHESSDDSDQSYKHKKESHRRRSKHDSCSDSDHEHTHKHKKESHRRSKHKRSTEFEHGVLSRHVEHLEKNDLEEGEISPKLSDQSKGSGTGGVRETSSDNVSAFPEGSSQPSETIEVSDDLRAKIRAMLMATR